MNNNNIKLHLKSNPDQGAIPDDFPQPDLSKPPFNGYIRSLILALMFDLDHLRDLAIEKLENVAKEYRDDIEGEF